LLARAEEKECENKYGESYREYKTRTYMFIPFRLVKKRGVNKSEVNPKNRTLLISAIFIVSLILSVTLAIGLKRISAKQLNTHFTDSDVYVSIFGIEKRSMLDMINSVEQDSLVKLLRNQNSEEPLIIYIMPVEAYISEIPMERPDSADCHIYRNNYESGLYKLVYTKPKFLRENKLYSALQILLKTQYLRPFFEIHYNRLSGEIIYRKEHNSTTRYGNIPEPIF
jgi:hypothetical protein